MLAGLGGLFGLSGLVSAYSCYVLGSWVGGCAVWLGGVFGG